MQDLGYAENKSATILILFDRLRDACTSLVLALDPERLRFLDVFYGLFDSIAKTMASRKVGDRGNPGTVILHYLDRVL